MHELPGIDDPRLLVGIETHDDAGVYQLNDELAIIQTIDFFTPVVDDPYDYGQIAVANSLSDIYAMGGTPLTALNIVGFPITTLDKKNLAYIIKGGWDKAREAGVTILGGHSVKDPEVKYGLAVTALAHPEKIIRNSTARPGDMLILTKPLGTGILTTALKNEKLPDDLLKVVTVVMKRLNKTAAEVMVRHRVTACTDVTGFGLLGHLYEMMIGSRTTVKLDTAAIPLLPEVLKYAEMKQIPGGLKENRSYLQEFVDAPEGFNPHLLNVLYDPQTSGGLLFAVPAEEAEACVKHLWEAGESDARVIGEIIPAETKPIILE